MGRVHLLGAMALVVSVLTACGDGAHDPIGTMPLMPPTLVVPAIHGRVREANGGPLPDVGIRSSWNSPPVMSDQNGTFDFTAQPCGSTGIYFTVSAGGYLFPLVPVPPCRSDATNPEVAIEIKGQGRLSVSPETPLQTILTSDDLTWNDSPDGYVCGPCKLVLLEHHLTFPLEVRVDWSTGDPLHVWLEGDDNYEIVKLVERVATPGDHSITIGMSADWSRYVPFTLKFGLPIGAQPLSGVVAVRVSARPVAP